MQTDFAAAALPVALTGRSEFRPCTNVFSTCPSITTTPENYLERVVQVAQWSERAGCTGILVYTDNSLLDPWLVAQVIVEHTRTLSPLVAVQPVYMHPYSVAKMVSSLASLYERRVYLNMVAGGFKNDLIALNDTTPHDARYQRLVEYTQIVRQLLEGQSPLTFDGTFYRVCGLTLNPPLPPELFPGFLISGSSDAGLAAARSLGAVPVKYPEPPEQYATNDQATDAGFGIRIGIIARPTAEEAWKVAQERFPEDRKGQMFHQLAMKVSDSAWHQRLSEIGRSLNGNGNVYWLRPFENYKTFCPYLVGSYETVAAAVVRYEEMGHTTFILDIPAAEEEFDHIRNVFRLTCWQVLQ